MSGSFAVANSNTLSSELQQAAWKCVHRSLYFCWQQCSSRDVYFKIKAIFTRPRHGKAKGIQNRDEGEDGKICLKLS